jgi:hypothetical protein
MCATTCDDVDKNKAMVTSGPSAGAVAGIGENWRLTRPTGTVAAMGRADQ